MLEIYLWSSMGDSEASLGFATGFGLDAEGNVHPPKPIPTDLRRCSLAKWEEVDEVFAAFGITYSDSKATRDLSEKS